MHLYADIPDCAELVADYVLKEVSRTFPMTYGSRCGSGLSLQYSWRPNTNIGVRIPTLVAPMRCINTSYHCVAQGATGVGCTSAPPRGSRSNHHVLTGLLSMWCFVYVILQCCCGKRRKSAMNLKCTNDRAALKLRDRLINDRMGPRVSLSLLRIVCTVVIYALNPEP